MAQASHLCPARPPTRSVVARASRGSRRRAEASRVAGCHLLQPHPPRSPPPKACGGGGEAVTRPWLHLKACSIVCTLQALVLQPTRGFARLLEFAAAAAPPRRCFAAAAGEKPRPWDAEEAQLAAALRAFPPGLKEGRVRPSIEATGHWEDGPPGLGHATPGLHGPWGLPDAARLGWLSAEQLRAFFATLASATAKC